ncbi:MAG: hypothetical protein AAGF84_03030 [Planctomycetota bacterium]
MKTVLSPANETLDLSQLSEARTRHVLRHEIKGVDTWLITVPTGDELDLSVESERQVLFYLVSGKGTVSAARRAFALEPKSLFVPKPGTGSSLVADEGAVLLKIAMDLRPEERENLPDELYPILVRYEETEKYRDYFKSEKTISRTLVHPFVLPRFSMGSVETTGPDRIEPHAHAMLDQLFFSFSDNRCTLLIDGESFDFGGNTLLHIPLGSDHGVDAQEGDVVNYLWLDFFESQEDQQYLVDVHKPVED